jgi:hypothetical protein
MKYFTRQQHDAINSDDRNAVQAAIKDFDLCCERYRHQGVKAMSAPEGD